MFSVRRWHTTLLRLSHKPSQCATLNASRGAFSSFPLTSELLAATPKLPRPCVRTSEEVLRSAPAPTASDACPFGSLNRTCRPRNYVNINVVAHTKATNGQNKRPDEVQGLNGHSNNYTKGHVQSVNGYTQSGPIVATTTSNSSSSTSSAVVQVPRMEIHQLTRRHYTFTESPRGALRQTSTARRQCTSTASTSEEANASQSTTTSTSAASDKLQSTTTTTTTTSEQRQCYKERCIVGWSLQEFYHVVADVDQYCEFLPWCAASQVHTRTRMSSQSTTTAGSLPSKSETASDVSTAAIDETPIEMTATLTIGFAFFKEPYTSKVTLWPGHKIIAVLHDNPPQTTSSSSSTSDKSEGAAGLFTSLLRKAAHSATEAARRSILKDLACEWDFVAIPGQPRQVEVHFKVSFEFSNPLYNKMIMSNVVSIMTSSFERRCERLYGPPSTPRRALPLSP